MRLLFCSTSGNYVVENLSAGDAVWLVMNSRGMNAERFLSRFPDAVKADDSHRRAIDYIAFDEDFK